MGSETRIVQTVSLEDKVRFLMRTDSYPSPTQTIEAIEAHMSWVFLTDRHAYKLKKPVIYEFLDFSTLEKRRHDCQDEVRLNRRLASEVYLGTVALNVNRDGVLQLEGKDNVVEWLVKMRRLPRAGDARSGDTGSFLEPSGLEYRGFAFG